MLYFYASFILFLFWIPDNCSSVLKFVLINFHWWLPTCFYVIAVRLSLMKKYIYLLLLNSFYLVSKTFFRYQFILHVWSKLITILPYVNKFVLIVGRLPYTFVQLWRHKEAFYMAFLNITTLGNMTKLWKYSKPTRISSLNHSMLLSRMQVRTSSTQFVWCPTPRIFRTYRYSYIGTQFMALFMYLSFHPVSTMGTQGICLRKNEAS